MITLVQQLDISGIPYSIYAQLHGRTTDDPADTAPKQGTRVTPRQRLQHTVIALPISHLTVLAARTTSKQDALNPH